MRARAGATSILKGCPRSFQLSTLLFLASPTCSHGGVRPPCPGLCEEGANTGVGDAHYMYLQRLWACPGTCPAHHQQSTAADFHAPKLAPRPLPQAETPVHVCENERCKPIVHLLLLPQIPKRPLKSLRRRHLPVAGRKQGHSGGSTRTMLCVGPSTSQPASSQAILCADQLETKADPAPGVELLLRPTPGRTGCGQTLWDKAPREFLPFSGQA